MRAIFNFDLKDDDDRELFDVYAKAECLHSVVSEMDQWLRVKAKYFDMDVSDLEPEDLEEVRDKLHELMEDNEVRELFH